MDFRKTGLPLHVRGEVKKTTGQALLTPDEKIHEQVE